MKTLYSWPIEKIERFKFIYQTLSKIEILNEFTPYSWRYLQNIASKLQIKKQYSEKRNGKIDKLFNGSLESFYWLGLITTDGSILKDGTLKIDLCVTDYNYLNNLAIFLETQIKTYPPYQKNKKGKGICRVKIKDIHAGIQLRNLLKIENKKTYNPISIEFIKTKNELLSFLCGYIDGDGSITKKCCAIHIDAHQNYKEFFHEFGNKLIKFQIINQYTLIQYKKMVRLNFNKVDSINLKKIALKLGLPLMNRKWDRIGSFLKIDKPKKFLLK